MSTIDEFRRRRPSERKTARSHGSREAAELADRSDDIQMFDVPPPNELRGIEAYRKTWPPFFEWLKQGAVFEIVSLDLTAGADVAFATALLRCGTEEELRQDPDNRLRLTIGLRNEGGRWLVVHEHHSFPARD